MSSSPSVFAIRLAGPDDHGAVAALWHRSASQPGVGPPEMPSEEELLGRVRAQAGVDWHLLIVEEKQRVVGMLALRLKDCILDQLFVCPSHFGSGLGAALFDRAIREIPGGFSLHTASTNGRARKFYERKGMKLVREGRHPRTGHPVVYYQYEPSL